MHSVNSPATPPLGGEKKGARALALILYIFIQD